MKRSALLGALGFSLLACLAEAAPTSPTSDETGPRRRSASYANPILDVVVDMTRAEVPKATILAYLRVRRVLLQEDVETKDLVRLRRDGVDEEVIAYIAKQSRLEVPPPPAPPPVFDAEPPPPPKDGDGGKAKAKAQPIDPDPGDTGLIMGVYDPIPTGGYPCWPPSLAPYECGDRGIVVWEGGGSRGREARPKGKSPGSGREPAPTH